MRGTALLTEIGRRLRSAREQSGQSLVDTAGHAGVSTRYLRLAERGEANLSLLKLAGLCRALGLALGELCDIDLAGPPARRVALLGVRGAGKTTVGRLLAQQLEVPFVELDRLVEDRAGMDLTRLFATHGEAWYRELTAEALEQFLSQHGEAVLATGGSIVSDDDVFDRLRSTCRTVWLRASADEHWNRVLNQGDGRPMADTPRARLQLEALLEEREPRYAMSELALTTDGKDPGDVADAIGREVAAE